ncbi:DUF4347 domain-containing protein [Microcoleus sp. OTE_8_concoct_300]|uniref:DUF4347 domain-containing protein n=1 Tax=Microcoleus sp. OTE_8_concoct_300 TaxID=2964710 RepID=UPI00403F1F6F
MNSTWVSNIDEQSVVGNSPSKSIVFIDSGLDDYQTLAGGVLPGAEVIILDKNGNGVEQITTQLQTIAAAGGTVDQVHIFSHGNSGSLQLGSVTLNSDNLPEYESLLQGWRNALSDQADIVLYGCDVAAGSGIDFVDRLGELTGADIAASTDRTGYGGNWNLEFATGDIEAPLALTPKAMADYGGTLKTITVTNNYDSGPGSLRDAIASAAAGDTINFSSSIGNRKITLSNGQLLIRKDLTIDGGNRKITISGNNSSRVIRIEGSTNVTLKNLIVANGRVGSDNQSETTSAGGGILTGGGSNLTLENCQVNNNVAGFGGGIYTGFRSTTTVINSKFSGNDGSLADNTERGGGAIATKSGGTLTIRGSEFTNNTGSFGGAVNNLLGSMTIEDSKFIGNVIVKGVGGAVYVDGANASGPNATPGPVGGNIIIRNSLFDGNTAASEGGAAFLFGYPPDQMLLENSTFINNKAVKNERGSGGSGGAVRQGNADLTVINSTFANNTAADNGGGMWLGERGNVNIFNSTFSDNKSGYVGGGILVDRRDSFSTNIVNTTFANNNAEAYSGGIGVFKDPVNSPITVTNSIFDRNTANNPHKTRQQTGWEFIDGGNNLQFPAKLTQQGRDSNATANISITDPLLGPLQNINGVLVRPPLPGSPAIAMGSGASAGNNGSGRGGSEPLEPQTPEPIPPTDSQTPEPIPPTAPETPAPIPPTAPETPAPIPPTAPETPAPIETPTETETPAPIETPTETETPAPIETPTDTDTPAPIETPTDTETPATIDTPTDTDTPAPIETPTDTETPAPIETPTDTEIPAPIPPTDPEIPGSIDQPTDPQIPGSIDPPTEPQIPAAIDPPTETPASDDCVFDDVNRPDLDSAAITPNPVEQTLNGDDDDDFITGRGINESINGLAGNDVLFGRGGNDNLQGGADNDLLFGNQGSDFLEGDAGNDSIFGGKDNDTVLGGEGDDFLRGDRGNDIVAGGAGNDSIFGGKDDDILLGEDGEDYILGNGENDTINAGDGNDIAFGNEGADLIFGLFGDDTLYGGKINDSLDGGEGNDLLLGGKEDDVLCGDTDNDTLYGGNGMDFLSGGAGDDFLSGDRGDDILTGGSGSDLFVLNPSWGWGSDIITDFRKGEDLIGLTSNLSFDQLSISARNNQTLIIVSDTGQLLAKLNGVTPDILTASDFTDVTI